MTSTDWIAVAAAIAAAISAVLAYVALRQQKRTQATSDEQQLNELIEKIQSGLGSLNLPRGTVTIKAYAASNVTLISLRGQALEARKLITRSDLHPDWFQNEILAYAFSQCWDMKAAEPFWEGAVAEAKAAADNQAFVSSLLGQAEFYYYRGRKDGRTDDWQLARSNCEAALEKLRDDPDGQGPDLAAQQVAITYVQQAGFELSAEGEATASLLIAEALKAANSIGAQWRRQLALKTISNLTLEMQQTMGQPDLLKKAADKLAQQGLGPEVFPAETAVLLSLPADGTLFAAAEQPAAYPGTDS